MNEFERAALRKTFLARRAAFFRENPQEARAASRAAQQHVVNTAAWRGARCVGLYVSIRGEVDTGFLRECAREEGREILLPRCVKTASCEKGIMEFALCMDEGDLVRGAYGIPEPDTTRCLASGIVPDLLVVPAVALDDEGFRLGYGGGYYDRLLARPEWFGVRTIGLVFSFQRVPHLERARWDRPLDGIATEKELQWLNRQ